MFDVLVSLKWPCVHRNSSSSTPSQHGGSSLCNEFQFVFLDAVVELCCISLVLIILHSPSGCSDPGEMIVCPAVLPQGVEVMLIKTVVSS